MSYDEHLISQAGGDGDALADIESRHRKAQEVKDRYGSIWVYQSNPAHDDRAALLALVREQAAKLEVAEKAWDEGVTSGWNQSGEGWNAEYPDESTGRCSVDKSGNPYRRATK